MMFKAYIRYMSCNAITELFWTFPATDQAPADPLSPDARFRGNVVRLNAQEEALHHQHAPSTLERACHPRKTSVT